MFGGYDGEIRIDTKLDTKGFNAGVGNISKSIGKVFAVVSKLAVAVGVAFGIQQVVSFGKTAVQAASDLSSAMVGLQSIMDGQGRSFADAEKFITDYIKDGLIPATNAITAYKNLASRGYDTTQIEQTMIALKDAAAFGRQASYTMGDAVQTATEGLKNENSILVDNAGVTKNVAQMWKDFAASIGTTVSSLTKQQKIQAEVNGILEETRFQTGDAAKVAGTYAGVNAALSASFQNFKVAIGNVFIPLLMKIIPVVTTVINWLTILANKAAQVINLLLGTNISVASAGLDQMASSGEAAANAQEALAKNTDKANKAAKGALASFDELNVLQMDQGDAGGAGAGAGVNIGAGIGAGLGETESMVDQIDAKITAFVEKIKAKFKELIEPMREPFGRLMEALGELGSIELTGLQWVWENILKPLLEWTAKELAPVAIDLLAGAIRLLNDVLKDLAPYGKWLWDNFLQPIARWSGDHLIEFLSLLAQRIDGVWITLQQVGALAMLYISRVLEWIFTKWHSVWGGIRDFTKNTINSIIDFINGMIKAVAGGLNAIIGGLNAISVKIPSWVPVFGGSSWGFSIPTVTAPQIPRLATGAVIPPNSEFLAVLGDQKSGTNIETPEALLRQIVREELGSIQADISIGFTGSLGALVRELKPRIDKENVRIGGSLVKGGATL